MKDNETRRVVMDRHSRIAESKGTCCASSSCCGSTGRAQDVGKKIDTLRWIARAAGGSDRVHARSGA